MDEMPQMRPEQLHQRKGAITTMLSGLSRVCNFAGRAAQNDDAVMCGLYMAQRHFASFSRSNAPNPDEVMHAVLMPVSLRSR